MAKKHTVKNAVRRLLVRDDSSEYYVDLPHGARVTFGPDVPFTKGLMPQSNGERSYALRVYRGRENSTLAACFPRISMFREIDIEMQQVSNRTRDKSGAEYIVVASLQNGHDVPERWTVHRRPSEHHPWGAAEHECASREEALGALQQMVLAKNRLAGDKKDHEAW